MIGLATSSYIAMVADEHSFRDGAVNTFVDNAMAENGSFITLNLPIAASIDIASPEPAFTASVELGLDTFYKTEA